VTEQSIARCPECGCKALEQSRNVASMSIYGGTRGIHEAKCCNLACGLSAHWMPLRVWKAYADKSSAPHRPAWSEANKDIEHDASASAQGSEPFHIAALRNIIEDLGMARSLLAEACPESIYEACDECGGNKERCLRENPGCVYPRVHFFLSVEIPTFEEVMASDVEFAAAPAAPTAGEGVKG
jgi:hypothetical protein